MGTSTSTGRSAITEFTLRHFEAWSSKLELDDGSMWKLKPFQREFIDDVFSGFRVNAMIVPEGNGKTTLIAGLALYHIQFTKTGYVPVAASSREQAEWIYRQAEGFVYRSNLPGFLCLEGYRRIRYDAMHSRIQVFAADDRSGDGIIPTLCILDELHRHKNLALYRTWVGKLKKRRGQLVVISTAGEVGSEFEEERTRMRQSATSAKTSGLVHLRAVNMAGKEKISVLHEHAVPEGEDVEDLALVKAANPLWSKKDLVEKRQLPGMTLSHWSRFTANRSTRSADAAIEEREWFEQQTDERIPEGEPVWAGLDVAWKYDTTALVPLWMPEPSHRLLGAATILEPPRDGTSLDPDLVKRAVVMLNERNPIHMLVMDTTKAEDTALWFESELGLTVLDRQQTNVLAALDYKRFMEGLREHWLFHEGDRGLTKHALQAIARTLPLGDVRFDRSDRSRSGPGQERRVIDALTAASMVHGVAVGELMEEGEPDVLFAMA